MLEGRSAHSYVFGFRGIGYTGPLQSGPPSPSLNLVRNTTGRVLETKPNTNCVGGIGGRAIMYEIFCIVS